MPPGANRSVSQTLITGVYRTGTEFLSQIIGCHPAISSTMYAVNVLRFIYGRYDPIAERQQYLAALGALRDRLKARYDRELDHDRIVAALAQEKNLDYGTFYDVVMSALYVQPPVRHWAEKNQLLWREIPLFLSMMPNGRTVLLLRDPRSVLVSFKKYTYASPPAYLGAIFNCLDAMQKALRFRQELPSSRLLVLRYEDVVKAPQAAAERAWRLIGAEGTFDVGQRKEWRDGYGKPWHANSSFHANDNPASFDVAQSIRRWEREITPPELALTEGICGPLMKEFGYETTDSGDWASAVHLVEPDDQVQTYFRHWQQTGEGIEAFPTDPLRPDNWRNE